MAPVTTQGGRRASNGLPDFSKRLSWRWTATIETAKFPVIAIPSGFAVSTLLHTLLMKTNCFLRRALLMTLMASGHLFADEPQGPPDLTKDRSVDRAQTYNLGSTGLRGWIYLKPATYFDGLQGRTTAPSRQILVTHVGAKSPADGIVQVDDVILGVGGKPFTDDARKSIAGQSRRPRRKPMAESSSSPAGGRAR